MRVLLQQPLDPPGVGARDQPHPKGQTRGRGACMLVGGSPPAETASLPFFNYAFELSPLAANGKPLRPQPGPGGGSGQTSGGGGGAPRWWGGEGRPRVCSKRASGRRPSPAARGALRAAPPGPGAQRAGRGEGPALTVGTPRPPAEEPGFCISLRGLNRGATASFGQELGHRAAREPPAVGLFRPLSVRRSHGRK